MATIFDDIDDFDQLNLSPLDIPREFTRFANVAAKSASIGKRTLRQFATDIAATRGAKKTDLPLFKLALFGDIRTEDGSLRHNENLTTVTGIEGDYDAGKVSVSQAASLVRGAGLATLIVTTPSHTPDKPRWRVLFPFANNRSPDQRETMVARANGAMGGILAPESFTASQAYYFGAVDGQPAPEIIEVDGRAIDCADDLDAGALNKHGLPYCPRAESDRPDARADRGLFDVELARRCLAAIPIEAADEDGGRDLWRDIGMALKTGSDSSDDAFEMWTSWSKPGKKYKSRRDQERQWRSFKTDRNGRKVDFGTLVHIAQQYDPELKAPPVAEFDPVEFDDFPDESEGTAIVRRLRFFNAADCAREATRGYCVKGLIAPGDVGAIYGAPGAGKSLIGPHIGFMAAQGRHAFGMRTKAGRVLYVAPEDPSGIKDRVRALSIRHGAVSEFYVVDGVADLLVKGSPDFAELKREVAARQPALIFIDTLAMAFPGLEENSAEGMGRVVAAARALTRPSNAAVVLIHHDTKAGTPTPRGHSLLNGALDFALQLMPRDENGIVRGRLSKNRNGPCDRDLAFRIDVERLGTDEDGDAITAALVQELSPGANVPAIRMTPSEKAARFALNLLTPDAIGGYGERDWRAACIDGRSVSASEDRDSRRKATDRAIQGLTRKAIITVVDGRVFPDILPDFDRDSFDA